MKRILCVSPVSLLLVVDGVPVPLPVEERRRRALGRRALERGALARRHGHVGRRRAELVAQDCRGRRKVKDKLSAV